MNKKQRFAAEQYATALEHVASNQLIGLYAQQFPSDLVQQFMRPLELFIPLAKAGDSRPVQLCDVTIEGRTARVYMPVSKVTA